MDVIHFESDLRRIFEDPQSLVSIRRNLKVLEKQLHAILRESAPKQKKDKSMLATTPNQSQVSGRSSQNSNNSSDSPQTNPMITIVKFTCEEVKCPFGMSFSSKDGIKFKLVSSHLIHTHSPCSEKGVQLKQLLIEVQDQSETIYEHYFLSKINSSLQSHRRSQQSSIVFERPAVILADYERAHAFKVISEVDDQLIRVKLKKKFDNVIQVLRRRFQKEFPEIECIFDEFNAKKSTSQKSSGLTSTAEGVPHSKSTPPAYADQNQMDSIEESLPNQLLLQTLKKEEDQNGSIMHHHFGTNSYDSSEETNWQTSTVSSPPVAPRKFSATSTTLSEINSELIVHQENHYRMNHKNQIQNISQHHHKNMNQDAADFEKTTDFSAVFFSAKSSHQQELQSQPLVVSFKPISQEQEGNASGCAQSIIIVQHDIKEVKIEVEEPPVDPEEEKKAREVAKQQQRETAYFGWFLQNRSFL